MKRILAFLLMLAMLFGSVCTLASCGDMGDETQPSDIDKSTETQTVPTGYSVWNEGDISFLYPSDWNKSDYIGYSMALDDKGNNINLVIENATSYNTELYKNYSVKSATELYKKSFAPYGMTLVNDSVIVEHRTNKNGVDIVYAQYDVVYQGVRKTGYQYIIIGEEQHHTITVTEVNGIKEIVDAVYNSINLKSKMQDKNCVLTFSIDGNEYNVTKDEFDIMMMYRKFELLADLNLTEEWDWLLWNDETDDLCKEFVIDKAKILAVEKYLVDKYNLKLDSEELQKLQYEYSETVKGFGGETDFEEYYGCTWQQLYQYDIANANNELIRNFLYNEKSGMDKVTDKELEDYYNNNFNQYLIILVSPAQDIARDDNGNKIYIVYNYYTGEEVEVTDISKTYLEENGYALAYMYKYVDIEDDSKRYNEKLAIVDEILSKLKNGADFKDLALKYSDEFLTEYFEDGYILEGDLIDDEEAIEAINKLEVGDYTEVAISIESGKYYYIVKRVALYDKAYTHSEEGAANTEYAELFADYSTKVADSKYEKFLEKYINAAVVNEKVVAEYSMRTTKLSPYLGFLLD